MATREFECLVCHGRIHCYTDHVIACDTCGSAYGMIGLGLVVMAHTVEMIIAQRDRVTHHVIGELDEKTTVVISYPSALSRAARDYVAKYMGDVLTPARVIVMDMGGSVSTILRGDRETD